MQKSKELELIGRRLAAHYEGEDCGICACLGIDCYNPSDPRWWYQFLTGFNSTDISRMVRAYMVSTGRY